MEEKRGGMTMKHVYTGKTKDVFVLENGNYLLKFKDDATGTADGVFDPGENTVGLTIDGLGRECLTLSKYFFELVGGQGVPHHMISADVEKNEMTVKPVEMFGKGLEVVVRFVATGSFVRRYGDYIEDGRPITGGLVEFTLKNDAKSDPPITGDSLAALGIMNHAQYEECKALALKVGGIIRDDLGKKGLSLYDMKFEFGIFEGKVILVDEISGGCMRVYKDGAWVQPMQLNSLILE